MRANTISILQDKIYETSTSKGFTHAEHLQDHDKLNTQLLLIVSEITEAMNIARSYRDDNMTFEEVAKHYTDELREFGEELADVVIRVLDTARGLFINLEPIINNKMEKNASRPYKHGKNF